MFFIRGKTEYELNGSLYSRNQCRQEHRRGHVEKSVTAKGLVVEDNEQALILGFLQYQTIEHLQEKNNASFEMGMSAGFETFALDEQKKGKDEKPYEETRTRKIRTSQDQEILGSIINSYRDNFHSLPPHPKQDAIA